MNAVPILDLVNHARSLAEFYEMDKSGDHLGRPESDCRVASKSNILLAFLVIRQELYDRVRCSDQVTAFIHCEVGSSASNARQAGLDVDVDMPRAVATHNPE